MPFRRPHIENDIILVFHFTLNSKLQTLDPKNLKGPHNIFKFCLLISFLPNIAGSPCIKSRSLPLQHIHPGPLQRQHFRRFQPSKGRQPPGDPPLNRRNLPQTPLPTSQQQPTSPPSLLRRRPPRPDPAHPSPTLEKQRQRHVSLRVPPSKPRLLFLNAQFKVLHLPKWV